jgi:hypothetical protein
MIDIIGMTRMTGMTVMTCMIEFEATDCSDLASFTIGEEGFHSLSLCLLCLQHQYIGLEMVGFIKNIGELLT